MARQYEILATTYDKKGRKIATATNCYHKTHPRQKQLATQCDLELKEYLHAEVAAIIRSRGKKIHKIKIERYDAENKPALAAPCPICQLAIREAGIRLVEYTVGTEENLE